MILDIIVKSEDKDVKLTALKAMLGLMTKQPDLLDDKGAKIIVEYLAKNNDLEIRKFILKWCKESCVMHEMNR